MNRGMGRFLLLCCLCVLGCASVAAAQAEYVPPEPADGAVDDYSSDRATDCRSKPMRGALAREGGRDANARGESGGILRGGRGSLHGGGRAVDWPLDAREPAPRRAGGRLLRRL